MHTQIAAGESHQHHAENEKELQALGEVCPDDGSYKQYCRGCDMSVWKQYPVADSTAPS